ncbi:NUDIX domain-containing protein [Gilvimarinus sp. DA14]|nr:NUDIX domain-containing protein [Gilvimarinus sp. DA14]
MLIHKAASDDFWALPGGRVELFESSVGAVERELFEELGVKCRVERLVWHTENFFEHEAERCHEVANYFMVSLNDYPHFEPEVDFEGVEEDVNLVFRWVPLGSVGDYDLYPKFLVAGLKGLPDSVRHVIINECSCIAD